MIVTTKEEKFDQLRKKRSDLLESKRLDRLRDMYGEKIVAAVAAGTGKCLSLNDFNVNVNESLRFQWPKNINDADGLAVFYISKYDASRLLICVRNRLSSLDGELGFHEKSYLGFAKLKEIDPVSLLLVAEATKDSVVFFNDEPKGVIVVDCYTSQPSEPFSVMAQGEMLVRELADCFSVASFGRTM